MKVDDVFEFENRKVELIMVIKNDSNQILCVLKNTDSSTMRIVIYVGCDVEKETSNSIASRLIGFESIDTECNYNELFDFLEKFFSGKFNSKIQKYIDEYKK